MRSLAGLWIRSTGPGPCCPATMLAATAFFMQTEAATLQTPPPSDTPTLTPVLTSTLTASPASPFPTAQNPLVLVNTLCWHGPGKGFVVSSSIKKGTRVILLGQGSIPAGGSLKGRSTMTPAGFTSRTFKSIPAIIFKACAPLIRLPHPSQPKRPNEEFANFVGFRIIHHRAHLRFACFAKITENSF